MNLNPFPASCLHESRDSRQDPAWRWPCFFHVGEQIHVIDGAQIRRIWRLINQSCTAATATTDLCAGALSWWNRTSFVSFPGHSQNVSNWYYFSKSWITYPVCFYLEGNNAFSIRKVDFDACQVLLLWHNSFLVSIGTFQPNLVIFLHLTDEQLHSIKVLIRRKFVCFIKMGNKYLFFVFWYFKRISKRSVHENYNQVSRFPSSCSSTR